MGEFIITTDNGADLPESYLQEHNVGATTLSYTIEGKTYVAGEHLPLKEFYAKMRSGIVPSTAQVNPNDVSDLLTPYLEQGKDVIHIALSSGISGTYNSSRLAGDDLREQFPERKIYIIDSLCASLGQGMLVDKAVQLRDEGRSVEETAEFLEANKLHLVHLFTVDDLDYLYQGGRVSRTTAFLGGMLNIKPVMHVDMEGKLVPTGKVRHRKKSLIALANNLEAQLGSYKDSFDTFFISHGDCEEDANFLAEYLCERYEIKRKLISSVGPVIGAHSGPGTMALFFFGDVR
ncbi:MAG: DegV family protein [Lachnospiraceae bacterium]